MDYGKCEYCGGHIVEKLCTEDRRYNGELMVFRNVPIGICQKCGERYYKGPILETMEEMAQKKLKAVRVISVPEYEFTGVPLPQVMW